MGVIKAADSVFSRASESSTESVSNAVRVALQGMGLNLGQFGTASGSSAKEFSAQWTNPSDVLSVLLIIGGDIVQKAIAQTAGGIFTPVCFSFGWVGYSFSALVGVIGDGRLLPEPDHPVKVYNLDSGYARENRNWIIGRILRDNTLFMEKKYPLCGNAIRISVYEADKNRRSPSVAGHGRVRCFGMLVMLFQLLVAGVPLILYNEWGILVITGAGTALALLAASLPQWRGEKLPNKRKSTKLFALTSGNGSRDIMIILGNKQCLDLEELSFPETPRSERFWHSETYLSKAVMHGGKPVHYENGVPVREARKLLRIPIGFLITIIVSVTQPLCWLVILISVAGLKSHTWFLLLVGGLGMFQNAAVAATSRNPAKRNLPLMHVETIITTKVMDGLMDLEVTYPDSARHLVKEFFPGLLRREEKEWWEGERGAYDTIRDKSLTRCRPRSLAPRFKSPVDRGNTELGNEIDLGYRHSETEPNTTYYRAENRPTSSVEQTASSNFNEKSLEQPDKKVVHFALSSDTGSTATKRSAFLSEESGQDSNARTRNDHGSGFSRIHKVVQSPNWAR